MKVIWKLRSPKITFITFNELLADWWMSSLKRRFTPKLVDMFWTKGAAVVICQDEEIRDWLASHIQTLRVWEDARL